MEEIYFFLDVFPRPCTFSAFTFSSLLKSVNLQNLRKAWRNPYTHGVQPMFNMSKRFHPTVATRGKMPHYFQMQQWAWRMVHFPQAELQGERESRVEGPGFLSSQRVVTQVNPLSSFHRKRLHFLLYFQQKHFPVASTEPSVGVIEISNS